MVRLSAYWGFIVIGVGNTMIGPALLSILGTFHVAPSGAGELFIASTVGYMLSVLIGGPASDHFGKRNLLMAGAALYAVGLGGFALAPSWLLAVLALFVGGLGSGIIDSGMNALANDISAPERHATEQSLLHAFFGLGALLGPLLIGAFLAARHGWRPAFAVAAVGSALLLLLLLRVRLAPRPIPDGGVSVRSVAALAANRLVILLGVLIGLYVGEELVIGDWAAAYLQRIQHLDSVTAATSLSLFWGGLAVGRLLSALLSRWFSGDTLLFGTTVFSFVASLGLLLAPSAPLALVALTCCGLGYAAVFPLLMALAGERFPEVSGSVAGLLIAAASFVGAVLPWISGVLVQAFDARAALAFTPVCAAGIFCVLLLLRQDRYPIPAR
ncbi:MAG TPA: MFS transporter [Chloroflexota bacterium]|nr:MFS transporter [Chloroflexota bacterium]